MFSACMIFLRPSIVQEIFLFSRFYLLLCAIFFLARFPCTIFFGFPLPFPTPKILKIRPLNQSNCYSRFCSRVITSWSNEHRSFNQINEFRYQTHTTSVLIHVYIVYIRKDFTLNLTRSSVWNSTSRVTSSIPCPYMVADWERRFSVTWWPSFESLTSPSILYPPL